MPSIYTGLGNWSESGCTLADYDINTGKIQCNCSHLTNFAVLVNVVSIFKFGGELNLAVWRYITAKLKSTSISTLSMYVW